MRTIRVPDEYQFKETPAYVGSVAHDRLYSTHLASLPKTRRDSTMQLWVPIAEVRGIQQPFLIEWVRGDNIIIFEQTTVKDIAMPFMSHDADENTTMCVVRVHAGNYRELTLAEQRRRKLQLLIAD